MDNDILTQYDRHLHLPSGIASREFFDAMAQGIIVYDNEGLIIDANLRAPEILGTSRAAMLGQKIADLHSAVGEDGQPVDDDERPSNVTARTGEPVYMKIVGIDVAGEGRRWLSIHAQTLVVDGARVGVASSFIDITAHRKSHLAANLFMALNKNLMHSNDEIDLLQHMCDQIVQVGGYALARIVVADEVDPARIVTTYAAGRTDYIYEGLDTTADIAATGPTGTALRTRVTQVANDLSTHPTYEPWRRWAQTYGLSSSISVPFEIGSQAAVLAVYARDKFAFDDSTVEQLVEIASECGFGVAHVRTVNQLEAAFDGTLSALARMAESRDPYTAGHQKRVGALGAAIAAHLGLDDHLIELIRRSGQVHDIGKISVPSEILTFPGGLGALEFTMIQRHTVVGAEILTEASLPWPIAEVALQHHERLDGSGYPYGLRGEEIILPARIIMVADVVEAMSQHRPYRPGLGLDRAFTEVTTGAGTFFDASVVAACLAVFEDGYMFESGF